MSRGSEADYPRRLELLELEKPLWIQCKGKKYNVHCGVYQD